MDDPTELYGLALDQFVPERTALAKALRSAGERETAARVAKLGKPTVGAWAVNQVVRTQHSAVARLFEAGDALKRAQADVVAGRGSAAELREATAVKRDALDELVRAARGLLDSQGHGPSEATLARVSATLDAAALQEDAREQVQGGCLTRELEHVGLGEGWATAVPASAPGSRRSSRSGGARVKPTPRAPAAVAGAQERRHARERQARRREAAKRAQRELERARARRDRAAHEVRQLQEQLDEAGAALRAAERALAEAVTQAEQALAAQRDEG